MEMGLNGMNMNNFSGKRSQKFMINPLSIGSYNDAHYNKMIFTQNDDSYCQLAGNTQHKTDNLTKKRQNGKNSANKLSVFTPSPDSGLNEQEDDTQDFMTYLNTLKIANQQLYQDEAGQSAATNER